MTWRRLSQTREGFIVYIKQRGPLNIYKRDSLSTTVEGYFTDLIKL